MYPLIRRARPGDAPWIEEISRLTWEGGDYLSRVYGEWIEEGNFFVIELDGRVVATAKLTLMPCKVGWMEGLRVHPAHRGMGFARMLHNHIMSLGRRLAEEGKLESLMYATGARNEASKRLGLSTGFEIVARFWFMMRDAEARGNVEEGPLRLPDLELIPLGWRFLRRCSGTPEWIRPRSRSYSFRGSGFFAPLDSTIFTPSDYDSLLELVEGMERAASGEGSFGIMIPEGRRDLVEELMRIGFSTRFGHEEPSTLVFELKLH